jgi:hypothetical protein
MVMPEHHPMVAMKPAWLRRHDRFLTGAPVKPKTSVGWAVWVLLMVRGGAGATVTLTLWRGGQDVQLVIERRKLRV